MKCDTGTSTWRTKCCFIYGPVTNGTPRTMAGANRSRSEHLGHEDYP